MSKTYDQEYREKLISAEKAAQLVHSGEHVLYGVFLGRPVDFDVALMKRKEELHNVQITACAGNQYERTAAYMDNSHEHFTLNSWFLDATDRRLHDEDLMYYHPVQFGQLQDIIGSDLFPYDIYVQQVSPMDEHGFFSFGLTNVNSLESCLGARTTILEVNTNMPRVPGGSEDAIHISMVDHIIEGSNSPLKTLPSAAQPSTAERAMAEMILERIPDRACLQLGIGGLPNLLGDLL